MKDYRKDSDYFHANREDLYTKNKNEFVVVKNLKVCHDANPLKLLESLMADGCVDIEHTYTVFLN